METSLDSVHLHCVIKQDDSADNFVFNITFYGFMHFHTTRELNTDLLRFKFEIAFLMRDSAMALLPWLSVMAICMISFYKEQMNCISVIITLGTFTYVLIAVEVVIFILIRYFFIKR